MTGVDGIWNQDLLLTKFNSYRLYRHVRSPAFISVCVLKHQNSFLLSIDETMQHITILFTLQLRETRAKGNWIRGTLLKEEAASEERNETCGIETT
jgi:hypothetical protein